MRTCTKLGILTGVLWMAGTSYAQSEKAAAFYHLDIVTREMEENKLINARTYSMIVSDKPGWTSVVRTGSRVPITSAKGELTFIDVGVNIDIRDVHETQGQLVMTVSADINSVETGTPSTAPPLIHQYKWNSIVAVPLHKATQIFSSDDPASKRKLQLEVTGAPLK